MELAAVAATTAAYRFPLAQWMDCLRTVYEISANVAPMRVGGPRRFVLSLYSSISLLRLSRILLIGRMRYKRTHAINPKITIIMAAMKLPTELSALAWTEVHPKLLIIDGE